MFTIQQPGDVCELDLQMQGVNRNELKEVLDIFVTYDPMNLGTPVNYRIEGNDKQMKVKFIPKYGAHVKLNFKPGKLDKPFSLKEISVLVAEKVLTDSKGKVTDRRYMDASLPVEERVESLLAVMTPEDKMELIREGPAAVCLPIFCRHLTLWSELHSRTNRCNKSGEIGKNVIFSVNLRQCVIISSFFVKLC